jgi:hypothetical protein
MTCLPHLAQKISENMLIMCKKTKGSGVQATTGFKVAVFVQKKGKGK